MKLTAHLIISASASLLMGCYSTPQSRIDQNPDLFASFSEEQKTLILKGKIELGFTQEMVRMAAGPPHQKTTKENQAGVGEVWTYYKYRTITSNYIFNNSDNSTYWSGDPFDPYPFPNKRDKALVVNFENGEVIAFGGDV